MKHYCMTLYGAAQKELQLLSNKSAHQTSGVAGLWLTLGGGLHLFTLDTGYLRVRAHVLLEVTQVLAYTNSQSIWFKTNQTFPRLNFVLLQLQHHHQRGKLPEKAKWCICEKNVSFEFWIQSLPQNHGAMYQPVTELLLHKKLEMMNTIQHINNIGISITLK